MKTLINTLRSRKTGYGHFRISIEVEGQEFYTITTNTLGIDAAFDDCYDDEDNSGRFYESREEAQISLVEEILSKNEIEVTGDGKFVLPNIDDTKTIYVVSEIFSNATSNELERFDNEVEANIFFSEQLKKNGFKPTDMESWVIELNKLTIDEDENIEDIETIESQTLYFEGVTDRNNYKGESPINYGFESVWNAEKKQCEYTFFFQGKKEEGTVLESELLNWYFKH